MDAQARKPSALVPIRVEFETDTHRIRDCFVWNLHEDLIRPESFARTFCMDLDLPLVPWQETVANQIRAQLEDFEGVASMDLGEDYYLMMDDPNAPGVAEGTVQPVQPEGICLCDWVSDKSAQTLERGNNVVWRHACALGQLRYTYRRLLADKVVTQY